MFRHQMQCSDCVTCYKTLKSFSSCFPGLMEILPDRCTMIAKKELIYAGTVGLICWLGGIVFINRKKTSDAKSVMADAAKTMLEEQVVCLLLMQSSFFFELLG